MKSARKIIHIVKHAPTGAKIPMVIDKVNGNTIEKFHEHLVKRKGFTLKMLQEKWDKTKDEVMDLLKKYQIPAHVDHKEVQTLPSGMLPVDVAIFFEEYIFALEQKINLAHKKVKSRKLKESKQ